MARSGWMTTHQRRCWPKEANSVSLFLQIWQLRMPILNQRLGSFTTESRAEIFSQCRQDCPLPPLINEGGFQGLREEQIGSKVSQKTSLFPVSATLSLSLSAIADSKPRCHQLVCHQLHHRKPTQPLTSHQAALGALSLLLPAYLSPLQTFFFFLQQPTLATIPSADASWATSQTTSSRPRPPRQATSSIPALHQPSSCYLLWSLHVEFILHAAIKIIDFPP